MNAISLPPLPRYRLPTVADNLRSLLFAVLIHVLAALLMFVGVWFSLPEPMIDAGEQTEVIMVDLPRGPMPKPVNAPKPSPKPAPVPPKPVDVPKPDIPKPKVEPAKVEPLASPDTVTDQRIAPPKIDVDPIAKALEEQQRKERREEERRKQLDEIRQQREQAAKDREKEERKLEQLQNQQAAKLEMEKQAEDARIARERQRIADEEAAIRGTVETDNLREMWYSAIKSAIDWRAPEGTPKGLQCSVQISMVVGGEVVGRRIIPPCNFTPELQESLLAAIDGASPLPYMGFESVFQRVISMGADSTDMRE